MFDIGIPELLIILVIILVLFGPGRLAGAGGAIGQAIREFRYNLRDHRVISSAQNTAGQPSEESGIPEIPGGPGNREK